MHFPASRPVFKTRQEFFYDQKKIPFRVLLFIRKHFQRCFTSPVKQIAGTESLNNWPISDHTCCLMMHEISTQWDATWHNSQRCEQIGTHNWILLSGHIAVQCHRGTSMGVEGAVGSNKKVGDCYLSRDDSYTKQGETIFDIHTIRFILQHSQVEHKVHPSYLLIHS
jgi:hypothetical protein